ncbi:MAG: C40 family peptidase [Candidatus Cloacimonetes bacterium]|nr:C40 family peptidase [Candidatus Cloacimonadota bacterium]MCF7813731.1 C40 family peptidase [Candidatus Cloacimonadota bacterium]MCF7867797.1 C40 family peptidase [Candidatus Cloacimonadota bacterium]MCF7883225.1 C40 family peptidase [Candidatus Cloacimonadota bacterium]
MKKSAYILFVFIILSGCSHLSKQENNIYHVRNEYYFAPHLLPHVSPEMQFAGYWIDKIEKPDSIILNSNDIENLNSHIKKIGLIRNVIDTEKDDSLIDEFHDLAYKYIERKKVFLEEAELYEQDGSRLSAEELDFYRENLPRDLTDFSNLCLDSLAFITHFSNELNLPGNYFLSEKTFDEEFNRLQNNGLDMGNITFAVCLSRDRKWVFQVNNDSYGWIPKENLFMLKNYHQLAKFKSGIVCIPYAQFWFKQNESGFAGTLRMGSKVWIDTTFSDEKHFRIYCPKVTATFFAYIRKNEIVLQPLSITSRNLLEKAFSWLNYPYGWGDTNQFVDCSKFIQKLYALFGINFPRNGNAQQNSWQSLREIFPEKPVPEILQNSGIPGFTLLRMPGHIMLYVGSESNKDYAIHVLYRYQQVDESIISNRVTNRIVISDLDLSRGTPRGSYRERLNVILNPGIKISQ